MVVLVTGADSQNKASEGTAAIDAANISANVGLLRHSPVTSSKLNVRHDDDELLLSEPEPDSCPVGTPTYS